MDNQFISIKGARTHNLKNIDLKLRLNSITCLCGPSGSGKSSLAFHTLLTESKRRFMNSFPNDVKFFWDIPQSADVDEIHPVLPVWGLAQTNPVLGSRPSAIDLMGLNDRLNKLIFFLATRHCSKHNLELKNILSLKEIHSFLKKINEDSAIVHFFVEREVFKENYGDEFLPTRSFEEEISDFNPEDKFWEIFKVKSTRLESLDKKFKELNLETLEGLIKIVIPSKGLEKSFKVTKKKVCPRCDEAEVVKVSSPRDFSPFTPLGACNVCSGHGMNLKHDRKKIVKDERLSLKEGCVTFLTYSRFSHIQPLMLKEAKKVGIDTTKPFKDIDNEKIWTFLNEGHGSFSGLNSIYTYLETKKYKKSVRILIRSLKSEEVCEDCVGTRLKAELLTYTIPNLKKFNLEKILKFNFLELYNFIQSLNKSSQDILNWEMSKKISKSLEVILKVALDLGLGHLPLLDKVRSLSVNDYQKLLLVKYLSFEGSGSLFVLDEASLGLDLEEQKVLMKYLKKLRSKENTIILVDHSEYLQKNSDEIISMGPGAGNFGGEVTYQGKFKKLRKLEVIEVEKKKLKNFSIPKIEIGSESKKIVIDINGLNVVTGKSYSSKKSFYVEGVANTVSEILGLDKVSKTPVSFLRPKNLPSFEKVLVLNPKFNRFSSRSTVGTMIGLTPFIRKYYASLPVSKNLALREGHFSPNSDLGKCLSCEGRGRVSLDMQFLEDVELLCDDCKGMKLKPFLATISDGRFTIHETYSKPMSEVIPNMRLTPKGKRIWEYLQLLNLSYLNLDRPLSSLSGGEKQRLKLLSELQKNIENSLVIFENLSFGLSHVEILKICEFLTNLKKQGNTIILVDESEYFSKFADRNIKFI